jgi:ubiquinone/menaquinone biosynthesis C-methylase UbiE
MNRNDRFFYTQLLEVAMEQNDSAKRQVDVDEAMRSAMEKMVPTYDSYMNKITLGRERALRDLTVTMSGVKPGDSVLEIGCGTGSLTLAAKRRAGSSGRVVGIDVIPGMVEYSRNKAAQIGEEVTFQTGNINEIPFPADQFDVVMCSFMIFHMSEAVRRKGIAEIFRVLKPQGRLLILDMALPARPIPRALARMLMGDMFQHDLKELVPLMEASGFSRVEIAPVNFSVFGLSILACIRGSAGKK